MATTTFVDYQTVIPAAWLNDLNTMAYGTTWSPTLNNLTVTNVTASGIVKAANIKSGSDVLSISPSTPTTILTVAEGRYDISVYLEFSGNIANWSAIGTVICDGTLARLINNVNGSLLTLTLSGLNVQVTQTSGSSQPINYVYTKAV